MSRAMPGTHHPGRKMRSGSHRVVYAARALALLLLTTCSDNAGPTVTSSPAAPPPPPIAADITPGSPALLIGAGDIARCDRTNDEATGLLLDNYPGATVFTAGDNTNGNATLTNFNNCYGPSWGRNKARTRPAVGNNDYKTANSRWARRSLLQAKPWRQLENDD